MKGLMIGMAAALLVAIPATAQAKAPHVHLPLEPGEILVAPGETKTVETVEGETVTLSNPEPATNPVEALAAKKVLAKLKRAAKGGAPTAIAAGSFAHAFGPVGIESCRGGGCWWWNETTYSHQLWWNGAEAWIGGGAYIDPWHCNGMGFQCSVTNYRSIGWNPAKYGAGQVLGVSTSFNVSINFPWGGGNAAHWQQMHFYGDGYVGFHNG